MTAGAHLPQIVPGLGGRFLFACFSSAGCLWAGVWWLVWIWSVWVVQVDMNDASDCHLY